MNEYSVFAKPHEKPITISADYFVPSGGVICFYKKDSNYPIASVPENSYVVLQ